MLNGMGLGFRVFAEDAASAVFQGVQDSLGKLKAKGEGTGASMEKAAKGLAGVGASMMAVGGAGFAMMNKAIDASSDFEQGVKLIQTIADPKNFSFDTIKAMALDASATYGGTLKEQTDAFYNALGSGAETAADAQALLTASNKLAVGGNATVDAAMSGLTSTINAYSMSMTDAAKVSDKLFAAVKVGAADMNISTLSRQFNGVSAMGAALGVTLDESLAMVARLTASGTSTSESVTGTKAMIEGILNPSKEATAEAKKLGVAFDQQALKARGLIPILLDVQNSSKKTDKTWTQLFHGKTEAISSVLKAFGDGGASLQKMLSTIQNSSGAADDAFNIMQTSAAFASRMFAAELEQATVGIGDILRGVWADVKRFGYVFLHAFNNLPEPIKKLLVQMVAFGAVAATVLGAVMVGAAGVAAAAEMVGATLGGVVTVVSGLGAVVLAAYGIFEGFHEAAKQNIGGIGEFFTDLWSKGKLVVEALSQLYTDGFLSGKVADALAAPDNAGVMSFVTEVYGIAIRIQEFAIGIRDAFRTAIGGMGPSFDLLRQNLETFVSLLGLTRSSAGQAAADWQSAGTAGRSMGTTLAGGFRLVVDGLSALLRFTNAAIDIFNRVRPGMELLWASGRMVGDAFSAMGAAMGSAQQDAAATGNGIYGLGQIVGALAGMLSVTAYVIASAFGLVLRVVGAAIGGVVGIVSGLGNILGGVFDLVNAAVNGRWSDAWTAFKRIAFGAIQAVVSAVGALVSMLLGAMDVLSGFLKGGKTTNYQAAFEGWKGGLMSNLSNGMGVSGGNSVNANTTEASVSFNGSTIRPADAPSGPPAPAGAPPPATSTPGVEAAAQNGASSAAVQEALGKFGAPAPINIESTTTLTVDGGVLAEVVKRHENVSNNRSYGETSPAV